MASAAVLLLAGCGGSPKVASEPSAPSTAQMPVARTAGTPSSAAVAPGTLMVSQQGSTPARTIWYLRIEDLSARTMFEQSYSQPIALSKTFAEGQYRAIVWHRACEKTCPAHGEQGLGPLEQVCGAKVAVAAAATVKAVAVVGADGSCSIKVTS